MMPIVEFKENEDLKKLCYEFVHSKRPKYVMGRNEFALSIAENVEIDGFIDDFTQDTEWNNKPIVPIDKLQKNAIVACAVVYGRPLTAIKRIKEFQLDYVDYFSLLKYSELKILNLSYIQGFDIDFSLNTIKYREIYNTLSDDISKEHFLNLINFRRTYDLSFMLKFKNIQEQQYFEPFINFKKDDVFIDIGGYDGFTTINFIQKCPGYKAIHFFEPDENNLQNAKDALKEYKNIYYYQYALSNKNETLYFKSSGSSSKIDADGEIKIHTKRLDDCLNDKCTYIKMDVEGWESNVIEGARNIIKEHKPNLAICVYHKCDDFWAIPEKVLSIRDDYKIYLRHYTEGITETVMYFI